MTAKHFFEELTNSRANSVESAKNLIGQKLQKAVCTFVFGPFFESRHFGSFTALFLLDYCIFESFGR